MNNNNGSSSNNGGSSGGIGSNNNAQHRNNNHARKRSRTNSSDSHYNNNSPPTNNNQSSSFVLDSNERLLRLNVGGHPYDVVRNSLPLLETMMTDRWLSSCLVDSDGRIFIDRDGEAFGDILRYLRGGADFLHGLVRQHNNHQQQQYAYSTNSAVSAPTGSSLLGHAALRAASYHGNINGMMSNTSSISNNNNYANNNNNNNNRDRLRRLRIEADYYGLHQLVHDIDVVTIGEKIVFEANLGWARVAGGCRLPPTRNDNNQQQQQQQQLDVNNMNAAQNNANNNNDINDEDQAMEDDEEEENDEEEVVDDEEDELEQEEEEEEDEEEDDIEEEEEEVEDDVNEHLLYKHWSWSNQSGNPDILKPHPTHTSSMIVGQDGSYLLLLRLAAALPSPLARIKWDQEEEQGRRVTRGASRRLRGSAAASAASSSRRNRRPSTSDDDDSLDEDDDNMDDFLSGRSRELEEDYFVTVNIEAPLQTVMDSVDESQTHFPLLRAGLWDYRTEEEVLNEDPVFATFCGMDVVSLRAGDILSVSSIMDEVSRDKAPFPDNAPPHIFNSLTLVKVYGNTLARYERLKSSPNDLPETASMMNHHTRRGSGGKGGISGGTLRGGIISSPRSGGKTPRSRSRYTPESRIRSNDDDWFEDELYQSSQFDCEAEEFDRSLTRTAHWIKPRNDFAPTPFQPPLHSDSSVIEFPHPGHYMLLGRVALGCRRDATFHSVLSGGPIEGHRAQLSVRSVGGRLLHSLGFVFEDKPRLEWADLSILSENAAFNDVVHVPSSGTELSITTTGDCRLHPEGTEVGPFCSAISQSLSCLLLDDELMEIDRYMVGTVRIENRREIKWWHTRSASSPSGLFDIEGHRLVWRKTQNNTQNDAVLIMGSIPPLHRGYVVSLLKNNDPISISITPESLDMKGRHCHYFQEIVELSRGDEITVAECAYGGEGEGISWRNQLHLESKFVEFDTRIGHLSFIVLHRAVNTQGD